MNDQRATEIATAKPRRRRRSQEEIMQRLLSAAEEEFKLNGFRGATTAGIARRADVTEAQLFRYFDSKQAIFKEAVFNPLSDRLAEFNEQYVNNADVGRSPINAARDYIGQLQTFISEHSLLFKSLVVAEAYGRGRTESLGAIDSLNAYFRQSAETMQKRLGDKAATVAPDILTRVSFVAVLANVLFRDWIFPETSSDDSEISEAVIDFVIHGITANDPSLAEQSS